MESPFVNDPFAMVWQAFKNLYPGKDCEVQWQPGIEDDELSEQGYGFTEFCEDGSILVAVDANLRVSNAVEVLAHELAHVVVGIESEHGAAWEAAFDAIFREYGRIAEEMFGKQEGAE
ncbi:hypothetical protein NE584_00890 [Clostridium sp. DFI.5.61]|uniref:hypothetical protein n=1 Tax=Clostridium sp. DFI.5.61 TaxID=2965279 RepID=UPI00210D2250|nr:hypothetical protein [Clostridium sp. DFI.5.61]MCB5924271.1 hypothetical protein [bacterium 210820-DFI.5.26]MCQ5157597.1 hypothetical protein [Clostridium sp. DFI.5.61]